MNLISPSLDSNTIDSLLAVPIPLVLVDGAGNVIYGNLAVTELTGRDVAEFVGQPVEVLVPTELRSHHSNLRSGMRVESQKPPEHRPDLEVLGKNGRRIPVAIGLSRVSYEGEPAVLATLTDLRRTVAAEEELTYVRSRLEDAQQVAKVGFWDWNIRDGSLAWSSQVFRMFGYTPQSFGATYDAFLQAVHPDDRALVEESVALALEENIPYSIDHRILRPDGKEVIVHEQARVWRDAEGKPERMLGTVMDITERASMQASIERSRRLEALATMAAGVAHDFGNVLAAIDGSTQLAQQELEDASLDSLAGHLDAIREGAVRGRELVERLMDVGRRRRPNAQRLDPVEALSRFHAHLVQIAHPVRLKFVLPDRRRPIWMDRSSLDRVITNLVANARDALEGRDGEVVIQLEYRPCANHGEVACVTVDDNGPGFPEEVIDRVFEPFVTTKGASRGTGLGLAGAQALVEEAGGQISAENRPEGGARVCLWLPLAEVPESTLPPPALPVDPVAALIVDDDPVVRMVVSQALRTAGFRVVDASDAAVALILLNARAFDVLVTDAAMPGLTGPELIRRARATRPDLPVLLMSGSSPKPDGDFPGTAPVKFLAKPFQIDDLRRRVWSLTRGASKSSGADDDSEK